MSTKGSYHFDDRLEKAAASFSKCIFFRVIAVKQQKPVGRDDPGAPFGAVGEGMQLPANGTPSGRALQKYVSFTVMHS